MSKPLHGWEDYIPLSACRPRGLYRVRARSFSVAVFDPVSEGFYGLRTKWDSTFVAFEPHWDLDLPAASARPLEDLGATLPGELPLRLDMPFEPFAAWVDSVYPRPGTGTPPGTLAARSCPSWVLDYGAFSSATRRSYPPVHRPSSARPPQGARPWSLGPPTPPRAS